jgi:hypothetical protein
MLESAVLRSATPRLLTLAVPAARAAMVRDHLEEIVRLAQQVGPHTLSISIVEAGAGPGAIETDAPASDSTPAPPPAPAPSVPGDAAEHPLVKAAERVFGAKVTQIHPKR